MPIVYTWMGRFFVCLFFDFFFQKEDTPYPTDFTLKSKCMDIVHFYHKKSRIQKLESWGRPCIFFNAALACKKHSYFHTMLKSAFSVSMYVEQRIRVK